MEKTEWLKTVKATIKTSIRTNTAGVWYTSTNKNGYRWCVGMPLSTNPLGFRVTVQKRYQATRTNKSFKIVGRVVVSALSLPALLAMDPEKYI